MHAHLGEIAALGTAVCWTATSLAFESAGKRIGSLSVNLIRLCFAAVLLGGMCWLRRGLAIPLDASATQWGWLALSGLVGFTIGDLCLFRAFVVIGARLSMLLMALVPPFSAVLGFIILNEWLSAMDLLGMALTLAGISWVIAERAPASPRSRSGERAPGILLGIGGAFGQALGLVLSKLGMGDFDPFAATQIRVFAGIAGFAGLYTVIGWWPNARDALRNRPAMIRTGVGAFFGPFLGVSLSLMAVQNTQAGVAATLMALVPILIIPPSILIKKEKVSPRALLGSLIAVAGSALLFL
jgi:drug/metabolite transporter (DMT)-like permease